MVHWWLLTIGGWALLIASYFTDDIQRERFLVLGSLILIAGAIIVSRINALEKNIK